MTDPETHLRGSAAAQKVPERLKKFYLAMDFKLTKTAEVVRSNSMKGYSTVRRLAPCVGIWLVVAVIFGFVFGKAFRSPYDQLATKGVVTEGWITLKEPNNHQNVLKSANVLTVLAAILSSTFLMAVLWRKGLCRP